MTVGARIWLIVADTGQRVSLTRYAVNNVACPGTVSNCVLGAMPVLLRSTACVTLVTTTG